MRQTAPTFTMGIEEEYLMVDQDTMKLTPLPDALMEACVKELGNQVSPEFLKCQIEVGTGVCKTIGEAREDLGNLRRTVARLAGEYGLAPVAASTHPAAVWQDQQFTDKERYRALERDHAGVARRMLICGMHVHVGIEDNNLRIDLLSQFPYFLPHLLALSTSSPFWEGRKTGLQSYRLTVFDNMPRTGLPPVFSSYAEYERSVKTLVDAGIVEDASKIWWDLRPSVRFPTLEARICDVSPRLNDALALAAMTQSIIRMLYGLRKDNMRWRQYERFLVSENRWRAQRYGINDGLIDFGIGQIVPFEVLLGDLIDLVTPHALALECLDEVKSTLDILERGTSADRQQAVYHKALDAGASNDEALKQVTASLVEEFHADL